MTTNQDRAAEVIGEAYQQAMESDTPSAWRGSIAQALVDAGLITPDTAAPELAAELHRIRRELEERIRVWQKVADKLEASGDTDVADVMRHVGRSAARILNGDTNE